MQKVGTWFWQLIEDIVKICLAILFKIIQRELTDETVHAFMQFVKFGVVGLSNTLVSYIIYLVALLGFERAEVFPKIDYLVAQMLAFFLSVLWSFYWNNKYVFRKAEGEERSLWQVLLKTYISYAFTGLLLNSVLAVVWVQLFRISKLMAPIINLLVSVPINFLMNKFWAFREN